MGGILYTTSDVPAQKAHLSIPGRRSRSLPVLDVASAMPPGVKSLRPGPKSKSTPSARARWSKKGHLLALGRRSRFPAFFNAKERISALKGHNTLCPAPSIGDADGKKRIGLFERSEFRCAPAVSTTRRVKQDRAPDRRRDPRPDRHGHPARAFLGGKESSC